MAGGFGAFGKMPALGDFIRIGLPAAFITPWDSWLQNGLAALKAELGERWQECFFSAPIWRFSLAPGLAGDVAMQGVLMASVDRVGRQFPLTLAAPSPGNGMAARHLASARVFHAVEEVALATLEDDATRETLTDALAKLPDWAEAPATHKTAGGGMIAHGDGALATGLAASLPTVATAQSIWTAILDGEERLLLSNGLPGPEKLRALFDMDAPYWAAGAA